ncbi:MULTISPECIES: methyltransferase domain-containing protein [Thiomicrorhabdus]|uniref:tRNA 5-carboxymethoxyuridine methyltransferase n=1 Tax=Thiomicrorhabdus heinhorstiae TaxID=2748010 RepID=A0ABS0BV67_9GAMM|nr:MULTISPECIES: methyltransferase domain-containing protein [Thiomicrorhabdus]MBF6057718.1 methyltransferase domain-containing protein [Thiomicrorhabdus heinhorstiae]
MTNKSTKPPADRNFDKLVDKFERKVYDTVKGEWRLKLLTEDLGTLRNGSQLTFWDAGCGFAQISQWLAEAGHRGTLCDLSHQMLIRARNNFEEAGLQAEFFEGPAQEIAQQLPQFDLVLFHAVLEWLAEPQTTLKAVADKVKPGGKLSLLFYNRNSVVIRNTLRGGWRLPYLLEDAYLGKGKKLTPPNPQIPEVVCQWLEEWGFKIEIHTGIRVFHDYMTHEVLEQSDLDELLALEYRYCRQPTYRNMARYIHLLASRAD